MINETSFMRNVNNLTYYKAYKLNILRDILIALYASI